MVRVQVPIRCQAALAPLAVALAIPVLVPVLAAWAAALVVAAVPAVPASKR